MGFPPRRIYEWILLNTKGIHGEINQELKEFLAYVEDSCAEKAVNPYLKNINVAVKEVLEADEWRDAIMTYQEKLQERLEWGMELGIEKGVESMAVSMYDDGDTVEKIARVANTTHEQVIVWLQKAGRLS